MKFPIPIDILEQHLVVLGKTGSGKSSSLRGMIEMLLDAGKRVCIIDPKGDHYGLKLAANGKSAGYPVIAFGDFKDRGASNMAINERSGKEIGELIATGNRPCVIGFRGWMPSQYHRFWIDFASMLFNKNAAPLYLVIDEVHNFAPKGKILSPEVGLCLHWTNRIGSEGRQQELKGWAEIDLEEVKRRLPKLAEEAKANDPAELKKRIRELERQSKAPVRQDGASREDIQRFVQADRERIKIAFDKEFANMQRVVHGEVLELHKRLTRIDSIFAVKTESVLPKENKLPLRSYNRHEVKREMDTTQEIKVKAGARRLLAALVQWAPNGMLESQMRAHAGLRNSGTYSGYKSSLRTSGLIEERSGLLYATQAGIDYLGGDIPSPQTTEEVLTVWRPKLKSGARRMLDVLVQHGGEMISEEQLREEAELRNSGTYSGYKSALRTAQLIVSEDGMIGANKETLYL